MNDLSPEIGCYLVGFIDGEGCFVIAKSPTGYRCAFVIKLRADDRRVLEWLCAKTGLGFVAMAHGTDGRQVGNRCPQVRWEINRKADVIALRELLETYRLQSKKLRDYEIWAQAVDLWMVVDVGSKANDWSQIAALKQELTDAHVFRELAPA